MSYNFLLFSPEQLEKQRLTAGLALLWCWFTKNSY